jgi:hypothetical protein
MLRTTKHGKAYYAMADWAVAECQRVLGRGFTIRMVLDHADLLNRLGQRYHDWLINDHDRAMPRAQRLADAPPVEIGPDLNGRWNRLRMYRDRLRRLLLSASNVEVEAVMQTYTPYHRHTREPLGPPEQRVKIFKFFLSTPKEGNLPGDNVRPYRWEPGYVDPQRKRIQRIG